jgi:hypothetical protein
MLNYYNKKNSEINNVKILKKQPISEINGKNQIFKNGQQI